MVLWQLITKTTKSQWPNLNPIVVNIKNYLLTFLYLEPRLFYWSAKFTTTKQLLPLSRVCPSVGFTTLLILQDSNIKMVKALYKQVRAVALLLSVILFLRSFFLLHTLEWLLETKPFLFCITINWTNLFFATSSKIKKNIGSPKELPPLSFHLSY